MKIHKLLSSKQWHGNKQQRALRSNGQTKQLTNAAVTVTSLKRPPAEEAGERHAG